MTDSVIPVDLFNPGQVFACLGFLEAADALLGDAEGGFDWCNETDVKFQLRAGTANPIETVLEFLASAELRRFGPHGYAEPQKKKAGQRDASSSGGTDDEVDGDLTVLEASETFPAAKADRMALPIRLNGKNGVCVELGHWTDGSTRESFKLYSGNRSAMSIASAMLSGTRAKPKKKQNIGDIKTRGIAQLWEDQREHLIERPFDVLTAMGGSFNFDPRGAWTAIDAGYSPNEHDHLVEASPVVELLAAWGLENTRPDEFELRRVRYFAWGVPLPPILARVALCGGIASLPMRRFRFELALAGKNKVVTFAEQEPHP